VYGLERQHVTAISCYETAQRIVDTVKCGALR